MPEVLVESPSLEEILWNFYCFKDEKQRLSLKDNPHFYTYLPASPEAYGDRMKIDPTENFRDASKFFVLTDKPDLVHIMTDRVTRSFGNFWCPKYALIFKGLDVLFLYFRLFLMSDKTSVGGSGEKALSGHLSEAHTAGSVGCFQCPPFQELPRIVVDCSRLSQRGSVGWAGNVRLAFSHCTVLSISALTFVLGSRYLIVWYVATLSRI